MFPIDVLCQWNSDSLAHAMEEESMLSKTNIVISGGQFNRIATVSVPTPRFVYWNISPTL
jgi:hypothetical protein